MPRQLQLTLGPEAAADQAAIRKAAASKAGIRGEQITSQRIIRKSVDARQRNIRVNLTVEIFTGDEPVSAVIEPFRARDVSGSREVLIAGAGPAGLFAALTLIENGLRPVIVERGRDVSSRKKDIALISREHKVDPDSNYCFGEGGAGTYSDGKLYTRSKKRGDNNRILELLVLHGADPNILYEAHPHLGTDKLPGIIAGIRKTILDSGGIIMMETRISDIIINHGHVAGVLTAGGERLKSSELLLSTGHSARDIYSLLQNKGIALEAKAFALGVRVEHPQELIDRIQYHGNTRGAFLPAASYSLVRQVEGRGVFSFCMCPGGFIVPSATSQEEIVVNGMSPSQRNSPYANSGIVVEIRPEDIMKHISHGPLAGIEFQKEVERDAWINGGRSQAAPAQRLADFVSGRHSQTLPKVSYFPGVTSSDLHDWLPGNVNERLREGFRQFGQSLKGYLTNEASVLAVESRTSSPVRIPRDPVTFEHAGCGGLYPCGEGSGYSGGIVSSAVDGVNAASALALRITDS